MNCRYRIKKMLLLSGLFAVMLSLMPVVSLALLEGNGGAIASLVSQSSTVSLSFWRGGGRAVTVKLPGSGGCEVLSEEEYICRVVACQMPAEYGDEAIKAQAVASFTILKYAGKESGDGGQEFLTERQMREKWGSDYHKNDSRLKRLVHSVYGEYIAYEGKPVLAAYHALSCGMTERGENVWKGSYPYLTPADSRSDLKAEHLLSRVSLTADEFAAVCRKQLGTVPRGDPSDWAGEWARSDSGYVVSGSIGGRTFTGQSIRNAFGLRSACFTLKYSGGAFVFTVKGVGHGVGMSQYGAGRMASEGATYREILAHYYKGTEILCE